MHLKLSEAKTESLLRLVKKINNPTNTSQNEPDTETPLSLCSNRIGDWDEIWLLSGKTSGGSKQLLMKVSLNGLSNEERTQLDLTLNGHSEFLGTSEYQQNPHNKTALFKFIRKSAEANLKSIDAAE